MNGQVHTTSHAVTIEAMSCSFNKVTSQPGNSSALAAFCSESGSNRKFNETTEPLSPGP